MIGGYLLGNGLVRAREADRSVTVRGLAERDVTADLATWTLAYSAQGSELGPVQAQVDANTKVIEDFLKGFGFQPGEISVGGVNVSQYTNNNGVPNITVRQRMQLRTTRVMEARRAFRSEEHTSELQSLMRISYAVFCLQNQKHHITTNSTITPT